MISIRGGAGLGDAIYVQAIARHLAQQGHQIEACSDYPDAFRPLNGMVKTSPFRRHQIDRLAHYAAQRADQRTSQFVDCCRSAGIAEPVELRLDWQTEDVALAERILALPAPRIAVMLPRAPFARTDGFGLELLPRWGRYQTLVTRLQRAGASLIQVGAGKALHPLPVTLDLANRTTVSQLLDALALADAVLGYPSCAIPLAEALGKPALILWSRVGLQARRHPIIRQMTPAKLVHDRALVKTTIDDAPNPEIAVAAFLDQIRSPALV